MTGSVNLVKEGFMRRVSGSADRWLWLILLTGLALHVIYATDQPTNALFRHYDGGDAGWYLANGAGFFSGAEHGYYRSISFYISRLPTPPFYILLTGVFQSVLPRHEAIVALRLAQCLLSVATAYLVFRLTLAITENQRAGLLAAALIAWHPAFIAEANAIATETCYIFFIALGLWLYVGYVVDGAAGGKPRLSRGAGVCLVALALGMATLTRAVSALFPLVIALHLGLLVWRTREKRWLRHGLWLLLIYAALVSTWTIYNLARWDRFVIVSDQLMPAIWRAAVTEDGSPSQNDALLRRGADDDMRPTCDPNCDLTPAAHVYVEQIEASIGGDLAAYSLRRLGEVANSLFQPHGTIPFGKTSIRAAAADWFSGARDLAGLLEVLRIEGFAVKLALWLLHLGGMGLGVLGMWLTRQRWRLTLPLVGFAVYTIAAHFVLLDSPRYFFPLEFIWLAFAAAAIGNLAQKDRTAAQ